MFRALGTAPCECGAPRQGLEPFIGTPARRQKMASLAGYAGLIRQDISCLCLFLRTYLMIPVFSPFLAPPPLMLIFRMRSWGQIGLSAIPWLRTRHFRLFIHWPQAFPIITIPTRLVIYAQSSCYMSSLGHLQPMYTYIYPLWLNVLVCFRCINSYTFCEHPFVRSRSAIHRKSLMNSQVGISNKYAYCYRLNETRTFEGFTPKLSSRSICQTTSSARLGYRSTTCKDHRVAR